MTVQSEQTSNEASFFVNKHGSIVHRDSTGKEKEYYLRDFLDFEVTHLAVGQDFKPTEDSSSISTETRLKGKAKLDARFISVIGSPEKRADEVAIYMRHGNIPELIEHFSKNEYLQHLVQKPFSPLRTDEPMGVANIGFNAGNWEFRTVDEFYVDLSLPKSGLSAICTVLNAGKVDGISVRCIVAGLYTTDPPIAPYASPAPLFLAPDDKNLRILHTAAGFVTRFAITGFPIALGDHGDTAPEDEPEVEKPEVEEVRNINEVLANVDVRSNSSDAALVALAINVAALRKAVLLIGGIIAVLIAIAVFR